MRAVTIRDMMNSPAALIRLTDGESLAGWVDSIDLPRCTIRIRTKLDLKSGERFQITIKGTYERCDFVGRLLMNEVEDLSKSCYMTSEGTLAACEKHYEFVQDGVVVFGKTNESPRKALHEHFATLFYEGKNIEAGLAEVGKDVAVLVMPINPPIGTRFDLAIIMNRKEEQFKVEVEVVDPDADYQGLYRVGVRTHELNRLETAAWRRLLEIGIAS